MVKKINLCTLFVIYELIPEKKVGRREDVSQLLWLLLMNLEACSVR
jgi:hypothetical protein